MPGLAREGHGMREDDAAQTVAVRISFTLLQFKAPGRLLISRNCTVP